MKKPAKMRARLLEALLRPQGLAGLLVFGVGLATLLTVSGQVRVPPPERVTIEQVAPPELERRLVDLRVIDGSGAETPVAREVALPEAVPSRLVAILAELEVVLREAGTWPEGLGPPSVFVVERFNRRVAVLDFAVADTLAVTLDQEFRTLESVRRTLAGNGVDAVEVLVNGRAAETFLGHIATDAELD